MKIATTTSTFDRRSPPRGRIAGLLCQGATILGLFVLSLAATFTLIYILLNRITETPVGFLSLMRPDVFWLLTALAFAVMVAGRRLVAFTIRQSSRRSAAADAAKKVTARKPEAQRRSGVSSQVLNLTRNAERLDIVERDLIRKISDTYQVDLATQKLLTEMRVCTNRLRGQLSDLERLKHVPGESVTTAPTNARQM